MKQSQNIANQKMQLLQGNLRPLTAGTAVNTNTFVKRFLEENEIQSNN
jgi:hypothetical protein